MDALPKEENALLSKGMIGGSDTSAVPLPQSLLDRAVALTAGMEVDLDAEIDGDVEL